MKALSGSQLAQFQQRGLLFPVEVLGRREADRFRAECDELEQRLGGKPRTIEVRQMHLHFPWAWELVTHTRVLDVVEDLLGPNLLIWASELFAKHPGDSAISIGWHRDRPYMGFDSNALVTAWIALSDSTPENGGMKALPGPGRDESELNEGEIVDVVLRAGQMSLHNPDVLHGSGPNHSDRKRVGFAIRFLAADGAPPNCEAPFAVARGRAPEDVCRIVEQPRELDAENALLAMKRSAASHFDTILENLQNARR